MVDFIVGCGKGKAVLLASDFNFKKNNRVEINKNFQKFVTKTLKNINLQKKEYFSN